MNLETEMQNFEQNEFMAASFELRIKDANTAYRSGAPVMSDRNYDQMVESLRNLSPDNPYINDVEPEAFQDQKVAHRLPMLSMQKGYEFAKISKWIHQMEKRSPQQYRITPKLDGMAGQDDETTLVSRGKGGKGQDLTDCFTNGLVATGGRGEHIGELVVDLEYYETHLSGEYKHPRSFVVGFSQSCEPEGLMRQAALDGAIHFVPFQTLPEWIGSAAVLRDEAIFAELCAELAAETPYRIDGFVIELTDQDEKRRLGSTKHHHKWQIAYKPPTDTRIVTVKEIEISIGSTGRRTPILHFLPIDLDGAEISSVSGRTENFIRNRGIVLGSKIEIIRKGGASPQFVRTIG